MRTDGDALIVNFSCRGDATLDRADLERLAEPRGMALVATLARACISWDAPAFRLIKRGTCPAPRNETQVTMLPTGGQA